MSNGNNPHHVVIIGGGFGGLNAVKAFKNKPVKVTLIDRRNLHLFQPLLYQVATGGLSPGDIAAPLRFVFSKYKNVQIYMAEVIGIEAEKKRVSCDNICVTFDSLIVSAGSVNHYFGHSEWERHAPGLKSIEEALDIRKRILTAFEKAELTADENLRRELLTFVIVGGGPTGVELAGSVAEIARYTIRKDYRNFDPSSARIILIEGLDRLLPSFPPDLSEACKRMLNELGVEVMTGTFVTEITAREVHLTKNNEKSAIKTQCVLWGAGIKASPLGKMIAGENANVLDKSGRVKVEKDLSVPGHPDIFVIGDLANYPHQTGEPLPGLAPVAMQQGRYAAKLILARLKNKPMKQFKYIDKGTLATIGRSRAVGIVWKFRFKGFIAWFLWLTIHLRYITGHQNKILILIQWAWNYFTWARSARVITNVNEHRSSDHFQDK
jgi:NADH dehydrogenase